MEIINNRPLKRENPGPNFRNRKFDDSEINFLKWYFIDLIEKEFFEDGKQFQINAILKPKISNIFDWVIGNIDLSLNKGLFLTGSVGNGKSSILKATSKLINEIYQARSIYVTANQIAKCYRDDSEIKISQYMTCRILFIDDIGTEDEKVFNSFPIQEVIRERYDNKKMICLSSNLGRNELIRKYTESIEDKINHMTYLIKFEGSSKR